MSKLHLYIVLAVEAILLGLLALAPPGARVVLLAVLLPLPFLAALLLSRFGGRGARRSVRGARRLSPEAIVGHRTSDLEDREEGPEELSRRIVERAEEIRRALLESPSEVQVEMCALGYRACVNDVITLTHLVKEELPNANPVRRLKLRAARKRATDSLSDVREAMPPGVLRATRQEHQ